MQRRLYKMADTVNKKLSNRKTNKKKKKNQKSPNLEIKAEIIKDLF